MATRFTHDLVEFVALLPIEVPCGIARDGSTSMWPRRQQPVTDPHRPNHIPDVIRVGSGPDRQTRAGNARDGHGGDVGTESEGVDPPVLLGTRDEGDQTASGERDIERDVHPTVARWIDHVEGIVAGIGVAVLWCVRLS
jgi:hypothetical protein